MATILISKGARGQGGHGGQAYWKPGTYYRFNQIYNNLLSVKDIDEYIMVVGKRCNTNQNFICVNQTKTI